MSWHLIEKILDEVSKQSTVHGKIWIIILFIFRIVAVTRIGDPVYADEQAAFKCNTKQPGCENVCFNDFSPISHVRFWGFQIIVVTAPSLIFIVYTAHNVLKLHPKASKQDDGDDEKSDDDDDDDDKDDDEEDDEEQKEKKRKEALRNMKLKQLQDSGGGGVGVTPNKTYTKKLPEIEAPPPPPPQAAVRSKEKLFIHENRYTQVRESTPVSDSRSEMSPPPYSFRSSGYCRQVKLEYILPPANHEYHQKRSCYPPLNLPTARPLKRTSRGRRPFRARSLENLSRTSNYLDTGSSRHPGDNVSHGGSEPSNAYSRRGRCFSNYSSYFSTGPMSEAMSVSDAFEPDYVWEKQQPGTTHSIATMVKLKTITKSKSNRNITVTTCAKQAFTSEPKLFSIQDLKYIQDLPHGKDKFSKSYDRTPLLSPALLAAHKNAQALIPSPESHENTSKNVESLSMDKKISFQSPLSTSKSINDKEGKKRVMESRIASAYFVHSIVRMMLEAGFAYFQWKMFPFKVQEKFLCNRYPCPNQVDCFVSRPKEKSILLWYMFSVSCICILLALCEILCFVARVPAKLKKCMPGTFTEKPITTVNNRKTRKSKRVMPHLFEPIVRTDFLRINSINQVQDDDLESSDSSESDSSGPSTSEDERSIDSKALSSMYDNESIDVPEFNDIEEAQEWV